MPVLPSGEREVAKIPRYDTHSPPMKYDPDASEAENQRRWLHHAQSRGPLPPFGELPADRRSTALKLARTLSGLEARICAEIVPMLAELAQRKASPSDSLEDYDITLTLTHRLRPSDPEWDALDDNLLYVQTSSLYEVSDPSITTGFGKPGNICPWNDWPGKSPCWTFLDLLESGLDWSELARIGSICTSLIVKTDEKPIPT